MPPGTVAKLNLDFALTQSNLQAFPPGKHFQVPILPNITSVNALGGFDITADRLAFIDGEGKILSLLTIL